MERNRPVPLPPLPEPHAKIVRAIITAWLQVNPDLRALAANVPHHQLVRSIFKLIQSGHLRIVEVEDGHYDIQPVSIVPHDDDPPPAASLAA